MVRKLPLCEPREHLLYCFVCHLLFTIFFHTANTMFARKRGWSLGRIFVSSVPELFRKYFLRQPIRIPFNQNDDLLLPRLKCDVCQTDSPKNFTSFKSYLNCNKISEVNLNSTPNLDSTNNDTRISDIQKELQQLKDQVAKILKQQHEKSQCSDYGSLTNHSQNRISLCTAPNASSPVACGQPPLPPPLPSHLLTAKPSQVAVVKIKEKQKQPRSLVQRFPGGEELLRDLKKVQLKKVQKSPGGGPLKKEKQSLQDPGNFLEEVLKKRFNCIQDISSDNSPDTTSVDMNDSFNSEAHQRNNCELYKKLPTTAS